MKNLLLFLTDFPNQHKDAVAPTLAWISQMRERCFEVYYDAYRIGGHCGRDEAEGGGELFGSTVVGGRHYEQFLYVNSQFHVEYALIGSSIFESFINNIEKSIVITKNQGIFDFYRDVFSFYNIEIPSVAVMIGRSSVNTSPYCYPEIYYRRALGIDETVSDGSLTEMFQAGVKKILTLYVKAERIEKLQDIGFEVEILDSISEEDNYSSVTSRIAKRWDTYGKGFLIGGPVLVSFWIPWCCRHDYLSIYGVPHTSIITQMEKEIAAKDYVVYGRQFQDEDFLELSKMNKTFQLIDPSRPAFPVTECVSYAFRNRYNQTNQTLWASGPSDEKLKEYAANNGILTSLLFWSGDLRSIETLYGILDLIAVTKAKAGIVVSTQWYQYSMQPYLELMYVPLENGGVFPNLEPLLGSSALGVSFEAYLSHEMLLDGLAKSRKAISEMVGEDFAPRGWFPIMDTKLVKKNPSPLIGLFDLSFGHTDHFPHVIRRTRPFDNFKTGKMDEELFRQVKLAGFEYAFTKAYSGIPRIPFSNDNFVVINLTAGKWAGWSPFIVVDSLADLMSAERKLISMKRPGWIVGVVDACCWTFTKHMWERGKELEKICRFLAQGGKSGKLINTIPHSISRYARIISK